MASATAAKAFAIIFCSPIFLWVSTARGFGDGAARMGFRTTCGLPQRRNFVLAVFIATFPVNPGHDLQVIGSPLSSTGGVALFGGHTAQTCHGVVEGLSSRPQPPA